MQIKNSINVDILSYIKTKYRVSWVVSKRDSVLIFPMVKLIITICICS